MADYILFSVVALSAAALGVPFLQYVGQRGDLPGYLLIAALSAALASTVLNAATNSTSSSPFGTLLASDSLGNLFAILTLFVTLFVAVASLTLVPANKSSNSQFYYSLLSFAALGMLLISYSADLLMLFVAWELMSIPPYALAGFQKNREESNEAAVKYAVLGALSSAICPSCPSTCGRPTRTRALQLPSPRYSPRGRRRLASSPLSGSSSRYPRSTL